MDSDGLFALEGMHSPGAEQTMVEIREALEYYCVSFLRPWLEEYFYQKVLRFYLEEYFRHRISILFKLILYLT